MRLLHPTLFIASAAMFLLAVSCSNGGGNQVNPSSKIEKEESTDEDGGDDGQDSYIDSNFYEATACSSKEDCEPASMEATASGMAGESGLLLGFVGEDVTWQFEGFDTKGEGRSIGIFLGNLPAGAVADVKQVGPTVMVSWIPDSPQSSSKPVKIGLRDMEMCLVSESQQQKCKAPKPMGDYDQTSEVHWEIVDKEQLESAIEQVQNSEQNPCDDNTAQKVDDFLKSKNTVPTGTDNQNSSATDRLMAIAKSMSGC